jgi:microcompartment protein CcmL/EutN
MGPATPKGRAATIEPALALVELSSIAAGVQAADAMAKRAPIDVLKAGTVHNGRYLVLVDHFRIT